MKGELIPINEFAIRISVSKTRARELVQSRALCDNGIAVNINTDGKKGGARIHWQKYLDYINARPAVGEEKRV